MCQKPHRFTVRTVLPKHVRDVQAEPRIRTEWAAYLIVLTLTPEIQTTLASHHHGVSIKLLTSAGNPNSAKKGFQPLV
jgi:hypothetical protein